MHIIFKDGFSSYIMHWNKADIARDYRWFDRNYGDSITVLFGGNGLRCYKCGGVEIELLANTSTAPITRIIISAWTTL